MGTFKDSLKKWFYTQGTTAGTTGSRIPLLDASGNPIGSNTLQNVGKLMEQACPTTTTIGNVMVVTNVDSITCFWPADRALESSIANIAVGAGIIENGRTLIIAKDTTTAKWATSNVTGGTKAISDRRANIADFDGRAKTTTILTTLGDNAPAAKFCNEYHPSNVTASDKNMGAGRWWLPSLGEVAMIYAHVRQLNFVLNAIGGTPIPVGSGAMWSSTEYSDTGAWRLLSSGGLFSYYGKTGNGSVRPVSAFY